MKMGGSIFTGRADPFGERGFDTSWGFHHREDLTGEEELAEPGVSRAEAYGILNRLSPIIGTEYWNIDRATRSFLVRTGRGAVPVTCVWQPNWIKKSDVNLYTPRGEKHTVYANYLRGGLDVAEPLSVILSQLRGVEHASELQGFDVGTGEFEAENGSWEEVADAPAYKKGAKNDEVIMRRAAYIYEVMARFTDAMDFFVRKIVKETGERPRDLRDKVVNKFMVPVVVDGQKVELKGQLTGIRLPLESRVAMSGEIGLENGGTEWNFVEDEVFFPYQGVENLVRRVEVVDGNRMVGGVNNYGDTRLYGRQRNDVGDSRGARLQHFLNETGDMETVVAEISKITVYLEKLRSIFEGEVGSVREEVRKGLNGTF